MKNIDLSQYIIRDGNTLLFPLTKEELSMLIESTDGFSKYIRMPYYATNNNFNDIYNKLDMDNDYWFLNSIWVGVDVKARAIIGTLWLEQIEQFNKIVLQVTEDKCESITKNDVLMLFYNFLNVNNYCNIIVEDLDKKVTSNEN